MMIDNNYENKDLASEIKTQFKENGSSEITLVSVHGIETTISKNDEVTSHNTALHILKENGEREIITFTDNIFKIIIK